MLKMSFESFKDFEKLLLIKLFSPADHNKKMNDHLTRHSQQLSVFV